jgi:hypothetical protein
MYRKSCFDDEDSFMLGSVVGKHGDGEVFAVGNMVDNGLDIIGDFLWEKERKREAQ